MGALWEQVDVRLETTPDYRVVERRRGTWSFAVHAQLGERKRRIGVLSHFAPHDRGGGFLFFPQALKRLGGGGGQNVDIDYRLGGGSSDRYLPGAQELFTFRLDVRGETGTQTPATLHRE